MPPLYISRFLKAIGTAVLSLAGLSALALAGPTSPPAGNYIVNASTTSGQLNQKVQMKTIFWVDGTTQTTAGSAGGGGGGNTVAAPQFSLPYYSLQITSTQLSAFPGVTASTNTGAGGLTISTMTVSSGTVTGSLSIGRSSSGNLVFTPGASGFGAGPSAVSSNGNLFISATTNPGSVPNPVQTVGSSSANNAVMGKNNGYFSFATASGTVYMQDDKIYWATPGTPPHKIGVSVYQPIAGDYVIHFPTAAPLANQIMVSTDALGSLSWQNQTGGAGGSVVLPSSGIAFGSLTSTVSADNSNFIFDKTNYMVDIGSNPFQNPNYYESSTHGLNIFAASNGFGGFVIPFNIYSNVYTDQITGGQQLYLFNATIPNDHASWGTGPNFSMALDGNGNTQFYSRISNLGPASPGSFTFNSGSYSPNVLDQNGIKIPALTASQFVKTDTNKYLASYDLFGSQNRWTGTNSFTSSMTVTAPGGIGATYGIAAGSFTSTGLGNAVVTEPNGLSGQVLIGTSTTNPTVGHAAVWGSSVTLIDGGVAGGGAGNVTVTGTPTNGQITKWTGSTSISSATAADIVAAFSTCSGSQYLGADGACHNASGSGDMVLASTQTSTGQKTWAAPTVFTGTVTVNSSSFTFNNVASITQTNVATVTASGVLFDYSQSSMTISSVTIRNAVGVTGVLQTTATYISSASLTTDEYDNGNSSTAQTIDWTHGNMQKSTLTGNVTFAFIPPPHPMTLTLRLLTGSGGFTATWPGTVKWSGASAPTITGTASKSDFVICKYASDASYYCSAAGTQNF